MHPGSETPYYCELVVVGDQVEDSRQRQAARQFSGARAAADDCIQEPGISRIEMHNNPSAVSASVHP
jgi:hypothetical protein